jgi:hypothetical protein
MATDKYTQFSCACLHEKDNGIGKGFRFGQSALQKIETIIER